MRTTQTRSGFTLLELMVVLVLLIILAAVALPSFSGLKGNADQRAAADQLRARIADARGLALQETVTYRLAINKDGTKIRVAPDTQDFAHVAVSDEATGAARAIETTLEKATVAMAADSETGANSDDWITLGTFLPNGTCREDSIVIEVNETNFPPIRILLRGVTGTARLLIPDSSGGAKP